jgi:hypothetical protein
MAVIMKLFKKKEDPKLICEVPDCNNERPEESAVIYMSDHAFLVCEECEALMDIIRRKTQERYDNDETL